MADRPRIEIEQIGCGIVATRTTYRAEQVLSEHTHTGATLSIPFRGAFLESFGRRELEMDPRCALYKRPGFAHRNVVGPTGFDGVLLEMTPERHAWIVDSVGHLGEHALVGDDRVQALARDFRSAWDSEMPGRALVLESTALQLFARLGKRLSGSRPRWLDRVVAALREAFPARPTLDELAAVAGVHAVHLAQAFARHEGCSIGVYVERLRIAAVTGALADGQRDLAQIALDTGFSDQSHMTRVFRRAMGTTPARYRAAIRSP